jgi:hypothetical protein
MSREPASRLELAFSPPVVRRALKIAAVVGTVLILINHGDALLRGDLSAGRLFKMGLTVVVPYLVSTISSVEAMRGSS